ncbi:DksA/TraR family C4-type zinc finger protein [Paracoccus shanxieyensis]|uniref:DksA/TraR family C4-type zinc finger protein n=1 Tax=Paracoccus shanxieyensis TaxID=2675752 RepID=A0A6L6IZ67_9RHOB|nr:DksA/TraR family C4-type zinc finger protein [Paracoccus shanxieyensis]MTH63884.1 DksA/TraR family C4-type zinc finger protein [Paracoccus shanxieyensis]MTH86604.1 DksA/TraR family C4-type zinc finger protein [Paracoccus shanxieyensis]
MAGGWARDDAVNEQIDISTQEAIARMRARNAGRGAVASAEFCAECDEPIPEARRAAIPGVQLCVHCQSGRDRAFKPAGGINRRASKDSQLR